MSSHKMMCPKCSSYRIRLMTGGDSYCFDCGFKSNEDHFKKTAELYWYKHKKETNEKEKVERIWFLIQNADRYGYYMEGIGSMDDGGYLDRDEVLALIERVISGEDV